MTFGRKSWAERSAEDENLVQTSDHLLLKDALETYWNWKKWVFIYLADLHFFTCRQCILLFIIVIWIQFCSIWSVLSMSCFQEEEDKVRLRNPAKEGCCTHVKILWSEFRNQKYIYFFSIIIISICVVSTFCYNGIEKVKLLLLTWRAPAECGMIRIKRLNK